MNTIPLIDVDLCRQIVAQQERLGVTYGLGAKAPEEPFFHDPTAPLDGIHSIDCSGEARLLLYRASKGALLLPDGSQNQRTWCEQQATASNLHEVSYRDAALYITDKRLFIAFIKPLVNGSGSVGHVWLLTFYNGSAWTLESHGGKGPDMRPWNTPILMQEVFSCYELPTVQESAQ